MTLNGVWTAVNTPYWCLIKSNMQLLSFSCKIHFIQSPFHPHQVIISIKKQLCAYHVKWKPAMTELYKSNNSSDSIRLYRRLAKEKTHSSYSYLINCQALRIYIIYLLEALAAFTKKSVSSLIYVSGACLK